MDLITVKESSHENKVHVVKNAIQYLICSLAQTVWAVDLTLLLAKYHCQLMVGVLIRGAGFHEFSY